MKTNTKSIKWLLIALMAVSFVACKKDDNKQLVEELKKEELVRKIADIIPKEYQDTLSKLGLVINQDINPPSVNNEAYFFAPLVLHKSNRPTDQPNMKFTDARVKFFGQDKDNNIKLIGKNLLHASDTSLVTAISGSNNQFTIYGKVKSFSGSNSAIFAIVLSGSKEGNALKDVRMGIINIDNSNGGTKFIKQGEARVVFDTDKISDQIPIF